LKANPLKERRAEKSTLLLYPLNLIWIMPV